MKLRRHRWLLRLIRFPAEMRSHGAANSYFFLLRESTLLRIKLCFNVLRYSIRDLS